MLEDTMTPYSRSHPCTAGCGKVIRWAFWRDEKGRRCRRIIEVCDCSWPKGRPIFIDRPLTEAEMAFGKKVVERLWQEYKIGS